MTLRFADPAAYQAAIRPGRVEFCLAARGGFRAELTQIEFGRLWIQSASESLPRVSKNLASDKRPSIIFLADAAQPAFHYSGMQVSANAIVVNAASSINHLKTAGPIRYATMSLPRDDLTAASELMFDHALRASPQTYVAHPDPVHMQRLVRLHAAAAHLARSAPKTFGNPEVAHSLEQALVHAMLTCLADDSQAKLGRRCRHHAAIIARFEEFLAASHNSPVSLADICAAVGASERTLRDCCEEHLGMGPIRYLWLRRMHLARRALILADPAKTTVTQIATSYGFWELGRFAVSYRNLFDESPSASLQRPEGPRWKPQSRPSNLADLV